MSGIYKNAGGRRTAPVSYYKSLLLIVVSGDLLIDLSKIYTALAI